MSAYTSYGKTLISTAVGLRQVDSQGGGLIIVTTPRVDTLGDFTNNPVKNVMVGLFRKNDSINPFYLRMTDNNGTAFFDYLKEGVYKVKAWEEGNSFNAYYDKKFGILEIPVTIKSEISDTSKILFANLEKKETEIEREKR